MIHILGDGPYAREVEQVLKVFEGMRVPTTFVSRGDDKDIFPAKIAMGVANPKIKRRLMDEFYGELDLKRFVSAIHHSAIISDFSLDILLKACVNIGPFSTIGLNTLIEDFVAICANVTIGHDVKIGKYSTIAPGAVISGYVHIGEESFIGAGAVIKDGIIIGDNATIGCGAVVVEDVRSNHVVVGNPAKFLKINDPV